MNAIVLEGRKFRTDLAPLMTDETVLREADAIRGSAMLRDAILKAKGYPVARPRQSRAQKPEPAKHPPVCCDKCGSPLKPEGGLISHIQATVAGYFGIHRSAMTTRRKGRDVAHPRQIAMYLAAELTPKSTPTIGKYFGGRDHTTVIHAIRAVKRRIATDAEVAEDLRILRAILAPEATRHIDALIERERRA